MSSVGSLLLAGVLLLPASGGHASGSPHSRVIVSTTLNSTLEFIDATTLAQMQPPLISRGTSPVRMVVTYDGCGSGECTAPRLFTANHGAVDGSVGAFDLSGDVVTELPLSPFPARAGAVGIDAATVKLASGETTSAVFVTGTTFALGGCGMPNGTVTAFERFLVATPDVPDHPYAEVMREAGTVDLDHPIPYGVAIAGPHRAAFATTNCGNTLSKLSIDDAGGFAVDHPAFGISRSDSSATEAAPDGVVYDARTDRVFVASIDGSTLAAYTADGARTAVTSIPGAHPIDVTLADSPGGRHWAITSDGGDDSVALIDRDVLAACSGDCPQALVMRIPTTVAGGAPEGVAYDPASNRIFAVNKTIGDPSLSVIQLTESATSVSAAAVATVPLPALGQNVGAVPALIAFDVVVQTR